ncbi:hypothetical protein CU280_03660 [Yersinia mollaretii]|nr:hypothetical protein CU280_03660 [Yersinia mollaretii]
MNYYGAIRVQSYILLYVIHLKAMRIVCPSLHLHNFCNFMPTFSVCAVLALYQSRVVWYDERIKSLICIATERQKYGYKGAKSCRFRGRVYY